MTFSRVSRLMPLEREADRQAVSRDQCCSAKHVEGTHRERGKSAEQCNADHYCESHVLADESAHRCACQKQCQYWQVTRTGQCR